MIATLLAYLPMLLLTLALECGVVAALSRRGQRRRVLAACVALNLMTHPGATAASWYLSADVLTLEALVFFVEWLGYARLLRIATPLALRLALLANLVSAAAGVALWLVTVA